MRILHLTSSFPRTEDDPTAPYLLHLASLQGEPEVEVEVLAPHDRHLATTETLRGVSVHRFRYAPARLERLSYRGGLLGRARTPLGALLLPGFLAAFLAGTLLRIRAARPDVIHAHWWLPAGLIGLLASRLTGIPLVVTLHGSDAGLLGRGPVGSLGRRVLGGAAVVGAVSGPLVAEVAARAGLAGGRARPLRMPLAVPNLSTPPMPPPPPPLRLLAAGRLSPEKGFDVAIDALALLLAAGVAAELEIVGDGPQGAPLSARAAQLGSTVTFTPACPPAALWARMAHSHAVVVPSRSEGLGLVALEALAVGRPVVASATGGLVEVVEDGVDGLLVAPGDPGALAAALRQLRLTPPGGRALDAHRAQAVVAAHAAAYADALSVPVRRWRPWRAVGALVAVGLLLGMARLLVRDWPQVSQAWSHASRSQILAGLGLTALAEIGFAAASGVTLGLVAPQALSRRRSAAAFLVAQNAKHLPGAVWPAVARAGIVRRWGVAPRRTLAWMAAEAVASVTAGAAVGGLALLLWGGDSTAGFGLAALAAAPLFPLAVHRRSPARGVLERLLPETPSAARVALAALAYLPVWMLGAAATAVLTRALTGLSPGKTVGVAGAAAIASVLGFLAIPVPAGLGVREAAFALLTRGLLPAPVALSLALAGRVAATAIQILLGALAAGALKVTENPDAAAEKAALPG